MERGSWARLSQDCRSRRGAVVLALFSTLTGCEDSVPSGAILDADAGPVDVGGDSRPDGIVGEPDVESDAPEDAPALDRPPCVLSISSELGSTYECEIDVQTMLGCDAFAGCLCDATQSWAPGESWDREACINASVVPRGAITLADFCALSGHALGESQSLSALVGLQWDGPGVGPPTPEVVTSDACGEIAAFTLWGESSGLSLFAGLPGEALPTERFAPIEEYALETPPLVVLDDFEGLYGDSARLVLNSAGVERLETASQTLSPLAGRFFLFSRPAGGAAAFVPLLRGQWVSEEVSSTRDGLVIVPERTARSGYSEITLEEGYPSAGPVADSVEVRLFRANFASQRKLMDAACISSCGCPDGRACVSGFCEERAQCTSDGDCCLAQCIDGTCR